MKNKGKYIIVSLLLLFISILTVLFFNYNKEIKLSYYDNTISSEEYIPMEISSNNNVMKDKQEGVNTDTNLTIEDAADNIEVGVDENGVPVEESTYLDNDGDTVPNANDSCPGIDDFSSECE